MKKIEIITLKALRKIYGKLFGSKSSTYDRGITDPDKASEQIYNLLASGKPCMVARYGSTEMLAITNYLGVTAKHHSVLKYIPGKQFLDFDYASPNGKNIIMRISYFDALS